MPDALSDKLYLLAVGSGIALHHFAYRHGEWDAKSPTLALVYGSIALIEAADFNWYQRNNSNFSGTVSFGVPYLIAWHIFGVFGSMLVYRAFFHRLSQFPGPFFARLSNLYITSRAAKKLLVHMEVDDLHAEYGDYVRIGPNEISITDPAALEALYGSQSKTTKGPWYTLLDPRINLSFTRNKREHTRRRKVWDQAFSTKALNQYEPIVARCAEEFVRVIGERTGGPINITQWSSRYAFEVMGNLAFGKPFNTMSEGGENYFLKVIRKDMKLIGYLKHFPWLATLILRTPILNKNNKDFWVWLEDQLEQRIKNGPDHPDIFSWLLDAYQAGPKTKQDTLNLHGDGYLIVIAGSDTTSSILTNLFFELARNRELLAKLQKQLDELNEVNDTTLRGIELLDGVIYEGLRLHPPVPSGLQRVTPEEGIVIGNTFIPGNTIVQVPHYTSFRDERSFERPTDYIPERWTDHPELVKNKIAFMPFLMGPYACVGRRLALMELRRVLAETLRRFDISLAEGQSEKGFWEGRMDTFTSTCAPLYVDFKQRNF